jgi:Flp pilus assembly pilin Flp
MKALRDFVSEERGQDIIEYTLLLAFILFAIIGLASGYYASIAGVTATTNENLAAANAGIR